MTRWNIQPAQKLNQSEFHPLVQQVLQRQGMNDLVSAHAFLDPNLYTPQPPSALPGMDSALERVSTAIRKKERICVWGDFDVDGQTSTTVLFQTIQQLGGNTQYYIPVRARESHGVHLPKLKELINSGVQCIVTCDTGISAHEAVDYAASRGVDMVITDHHDLPEKLPRAAAITNPKMLPANHPLSGLAGVGVAYKMAEGLSHLFQELNFNPEELLDLVALGLVADLAILTQDTRYLVQKGLQQLKITQRAGLKAMYEFANLNPAHINEGHIGFTLGPRLNALGRLEDANPAVELLSTADMTRAKVLAAKLEGLNAQRKLLLEQVTSAAEAQLRSDPGLLTQPIIILHHPHWPGGIVGIAASRLVERYHKPAILLTGEPEQGLRGSARSIDGLHITEAIRASQHLLTNFGGHPMAAGLGLPADNLTEFRKELAKSVEQQLGKTQIEAEINIDTFINFEEITPSLVNQLEQLAPFGPGNESLTFATANLKLINKQPIGKNREHLRLEVEDSNRNIQTVLWWGGANEELPEDGFDLAYRLRSSDYKGQKQVSLELVDSRPIQRESIEIKSKKLQVIDLRNQPVSDKEIKSYLKEGSAQIWSEAEHKSTVSGLSRHELTPCSTLIIYSAPPSAQVLRDVLLKTKPKKVIIFSAKPTANEPKLFLERLVGLCKFVINNRGGQVNMTELAAASAQTEGAVRAGIMWLEADGKLGVSESQNGEISLTFSQAGFNESVRSQWQSTLHYLLNESAAYRVYFSKANPNKIFELND